MRVGRGSSARRRCPLAAPCKCKVWLASPIVVAESPLAGAISNRRRAQVRAARPASLVGSHKAAVLGAPTETRSSYSSSREKMTVLRRFRSESGPAAFHACAGPSSFPITKSSRCGSIERLLAHAATC
jgi:hypothetical protein